MGPAELFETLTFDGIEGFVANRQEEHLHLEFKVVRDANLSSRDDRRNFACALSGFANSAGGLIVWGISARRNEDGIDCASEVQWIANVGALVTRLNALTGEALDPIATLVRHRHIARADGSGVALTLVGESDTGPHMAKLGEDRYYKRSGDGLYRMEHYDIADMFGRRRRPKLSVFYRVLERGQQVTVFLGVRNDGRATAHAPFFAFQNQGPLQRSSYGLDGNRNEGLNLLRGGASGLTWAYGGGMDFALHPGMAHEIAKLDLGLTPRQRPTEDVVIEYALACVDQPLERATLVIPLQELA